MLGKILLSYTKRLLDPHHVIWPEPPAYMQVPRCDQCRFWQQAPNARRPTKPDEGACRRIPLDIGERACADKARIRFKDVNGVGLMTDADFGCVQREEKQ